MDILVLLFVIILLVIDSNVRRRVIDALAAAVNLRHSVDTAHDTRDTRNDTDDTDSDTHVTRDDTDDTDSDTNVTRNDTSSDMHVKRSDTDVKDNDTHVTDSVTVSHDAIDAVSRLVAADVISATRACQIAFNVSQRGNAAIYRAVRARVAEIKKMSQTMSHMSQRDDIVDIRADGRVIRCDADGRHYVVHSNGKKEYILDKEINV